MPEPGPQTIRSCTALIGDVPFLNGGLFEETDLDQAKGHRRSPTPYHRTDIDRRLFERFNFTVMESTPYDVEVAVDPEMLGKVFEELVTEPHMTPAPTIHPDQWSPLCVGKP